MNKVILAIAFIVALSNAGSPNKILFGPHTVTYTITNGVMNVKIDAKNNGWVAFGFGDSMVNADIVTCRVDNGNVLVEDRWSTVRGQAPPLDTTQNWTKVSGGFNNGVWDITISRNLSTGDTQDTQITNGKRYDTLFAIGTEQTFTQKHKFFWEYEDIKYSDEQLDDQDGAAGHLRVALSLIIGLVICLIM